MRSTLRGIAARTARIERFTRKQGITAAIMRPRIPVPAATWDHRSVRGVRSSSPALLRDERDPHAHLARADRPEHVLRMVLLIEVVAGVPEHPAVAVEDRARRAHRLGGPGMALHLHDVALDFAEVDAVLAL